MQSISRIAAFAVRRAVFTAARTSASSAAPAAFKAIPRTFAPAAAPVRFFSAGHGGLTKDAVTQRVMQVLRGMDKVNPSKVTPTAHFTNDLGLDSLDVVELVLAIEEEFAIEISHEDAERVNSVADAISYISSHAHAK